MGTGLADFVVRARTPVERDGYTRDVLVMPSAEAPGRLVGVLGQLLGGLELIGCRTERAYEVVAKTGWDCVPDVGRRLLHALYGHGACRTAKLTQTTGIPKKTAELALEDLALIGIVREEREGDTATSARVWRLDTEWPPDVPGASHETSEHADTASHETSEHHSLITTSTRSEDFSREATRDVVDRVVTAF